MKEEISYGVVPVSLAHDGGEPRYLIVLQDTGSWSFPKGHPDEGEAPLQTARRELAEEVGITEVAFEFETCFDVAYTHRKDGEEIHKTVRHFVGFVHDARVTSQEDEIVDWRWAMCEEAGDLLHDNTKECVLNPVHQYLLSS